VVKRERGYSLIEISVTLALFGVFLFIIVTLTAEMRRNEKRWPVDFMAHPDVSAVVSRLRRDVYDSKYFPDAWQSYTNGDSTPIIYRITPSGSGETIVWDFRTPGQVTRHAWTANQPQGDWVARGTPSFTTQQYDAPNGQRGLRVLAVDDKGKLAIDQILIPRPHE
jgi:prepilin-type N-terminal cleavage/methylation domain-containing protein